jgi:translation initiation factor 2 alpha subunit (eIF-2alpha)
VNALPDEQPASIQVQVTEEMADRIDTTGRYQVRGSTVSVMGAFHLVCGEHDGLSDLHATSLEVTQAGKASPAEFDVGEFIPAAALVVAGLVLYGFYLRKREELR